MPQAWVYYLVAYGGLLGVILENVEGILKAFYGQESAMNKFVRVLQQFIPEFVWQVDKLKLSDYMVPHMRVSVFLRGIRRSVLEQVPPVLPPFGGVNLRAALGKFPNAVRSSFTKPQQRNMLDYERLVRNMFTKSLVVFGDVVVIALDRAKGKTYKQHVQVNRCPTLTRKNTYLFILSVTDVLCSLAGL